MRLPGGHPRRRIVAAAVIALLGFLLTGWLPGSVAVAQPAPNSVLVTVLKVTPSTPTASTKPQPLDVILKLTNTTAEPLGMVSVHGARGNPISNHAALDSAIATPQPPDPSLVAPFAAKTALTVNLGAGTSRTVSYATTTSNTTSPSGVCLCQDRIYPLYFTVQVAATGALVGSAQTFMPSFVADSTAQPVRVSWVWPILERPHRSTRDTVFTDDDLAKSVAAGGRLDRLLQVVQGVGANVPMTLLVDPDLIDELAVMATGDYTVVTGPGRTAPGTGAAAAKQWLLRLRNALDANPGLELSFTPYADPDVDSLARNGLGWATSQSAAATARVRAALGGRTVPSDIAWPVDGSLSPGTLSTLVGKGARTVIVDDTTLPGGTHSSPLPDALATLPTDSGKATMAVTSAAIEQFAAQVVTRGRDGLAKLPQLVSEVAVRTIEDSAHSHYVLITAPRDLDPEPSAAVAAIKQTASTIWSRPLGLRNATRTVTPVDHGKLAAGRPDTGLSAAVISTLQLVTDSLPGLASMIPDPNQRALLVGSLPDGVQRSESSAWIAEPAAGLGRARALRQRVSTVTDGVRLVKPTTGTYTLGSADSPLPITIENTLAAQVLVRVRVSTVGGLPGFSADDVGIQPLGPKSKLPLHIPVHVERAGRINVQVELTAPDGAPLGTPLPLSVRSTALGYIGKIITFVAGAVLAAALLFRVLRRWRRHSNGASRSAA